MPHNDHTAGQSSVASPPSASSSVNFDYTAYKSVFDFMLNGMIYCEMLFEDERPADFVFLHTNPAFEQQTAMRDVCGKRASEVIAGIRDNDPQLIEILGRIARGGAPEQFQIYVQALAMWFSVSAFSPKNNHFLALFDVITEHKLAEEVLRASEARYLDIFDNTNDLIQCVLPDGSFVYTNRAWRETLGYTELEVRSLSLTDVLHPDSLDCCQDRFRRLLNGESLTCIDFKYISRSGEPVYLSGDCGSIIKNGGVISTRGIFKNITDTVKAGKALKLSDARYKTLYEIAPDIFISLNRDCEIISINRTGARMLGYEVGQLVGQSVSMVIHPEDQASVFTYIRKHFTETCSDGGIEYPRVQSQSATPRG